MPLQIRRGTQAEREALTVPPADGELVYEKDTGLLYIGDGVTPGGNLVVSIAEDDVQDLVASLFENGEHVGISYSSVNGQIDTTVDLSSYNGNFATGGVVSSLVPGTDGALSLGSAEQGFRNLYVTDGISIDGSIIDTENGVINLPEGTTIGGSPLVSAEGNVTINIVGVDSTVIVDASTNTFIGTFEGELVGSVRGGDSTTLLDANSRTLTVDTINTSLIDTATESLFLNSTSTTPLAIRAAPISGSPTISLEVSRGTPDEPENTLAGNIVGGFKVLGYNNEYKYVAGFMTQWENTADFDRQFPNSKILFITGDNSNFQKVRASIDSTGMFTASTIQPGVYVDATARDETISSPVAGMMIFNTALQKFQGYVDDTGLAGGGAPNTTPGWINLN